MINLPNRKSIRLQNYDYTQEGLYFVAICTHERKNLFGEIVGATCESPAYMQLNEYGKIVESVWQSLPNRFPVKLNAFQIMPNHVHAIINIVGAGYSRPTLGQIIAFFKYQSTKSINELSGAKTAPLRNKSIYFPKIFQRNYYEHIIRNEKELFEIREYIQTNPRRWERDRNNLESP